MYIYICQVNLFIDFCMLVVCMYVSMYCTILYVCTISNVFYNKIDSTVSFENLRRYIHSYIHTYAF